MLPVAVIVEKFGYDLAKNRLSRVILTRVRERGKLWLLYAGIWNRDVLYSNMHDATLAASSIDSSSSFWEIECRVFDRDRFDTDHQSVG